MTNTPDTRPTVSPIEGHYAMLRNGMVVRPKMDDDSRKPFFYDAEMDWYADGRAMVDPLDKVRAKYVSDFDIIATISPASLAFAIEVENMPAVDLKSELPDEKPGVWVNSDDYAAYKALIPLADAVCDYADANCRAFPIATAPKKHGPDVELLCGNIWVRACWSDLHGWVATHINQYVADPTYWRPTRSPDKDLPAVFTQLGQALERLKGA